MNGKLSDKRFEMLLADYETEQSELELSVNTLEKALNDYQENADNVDKFIELVHRYTDFTELTPEQIKEEERKHRKRAWNRDIWHIITSFLYLWRRCSKRDWY